MTSDVSSPWHPGELVLQHKVGAVERLDDIGRRVIRDHMIDQHRLFFSQLSYVVMGSVDNQGDAWATMRTGVPGFLQSPDPHNLVVRIGFDTGDPSDEGIRQGAPIGMLGIELHSRRRNRLNGIVGPRDEQGFSLAVVQSFGNCPRYIHRRDAYVINSEADDPAGRTVAITAHGSLVRETVARADTFFVASYADIEQRGRHVDVSHRGGAPGFICALNDGSLIIPDYSGNHYFNTLGNMLLNPKVGLLFPDFASGSLLQLTGDVDIDLTSNAIATFPGAERLWMFRPRLAFHSAAALAMRWTLRDSVIQPAAAD